MCKIFPHFSKKTFSHPFSFLDFLQISKKWAYFWYNFQGYVHENSCTINISDNTSTPPPWQKAEASAQSHRFPICGTAFAAGTSAGLKGRSQCLEQNQFRSTLIPVLCPFRSYSFRSLPSAISRASVSFMIYSLCA